MKMMCLAIAALWATVSSAPALGEVVKSIKTERGDSVEVIEDVPPGSGPFPAVILAPGGAYHARAPIPEGLSKSLIASGIAVFRFNWSYYPKSGPDGRAQDDWSVESHDMKAVLESALADSRIAKGKVVLAGKSRGSIIAWRVLQSTPEAKAAVLLTPVCSRASKENPAPQPVDYYRGSGSEMRPVLMISGDNDPYCSTPLLYQFAASYGGPLRLAVIRGNHSLEVGNNKDAANAGPNAANVELAVSVAADFIRQFAR
jgi:predicted esterase